MFKWLFLSSFKEIYQTVIKTFSFSSRFIFTTNAIYGHNVELSLPVFGFIYFCLNDWISPQVKIENFQWTITLIIGHKFWCDIPQWSQFTVIKIQYSLHIVFEQDIVGFWNCSIWWDIKLLFWILIRLLLSKKKQG